MNRWYLRNLKRLQEANIPLNIEGISTDISLQSFELIEKDVIRTFPYEKGFDRKILTELLIKFESLEPKIGYVQGMNYLMAALLFHAGSE